MTRPTTTLCVDLDGTLIRTDSLLENGLQFFRSYPARIFEIVLALLKGRARLKQFLARNSPLDPCALPYREPLLDWLREEGRRGRPLVLVTAADQSIADSVQEHLGLFDRVMGSNGDGNLKGARKRELLERSFGRGNYVYAGDSRADLPVWSGAAAAVLVGRAARFAPKLTAAGVPIERSFPADRARFRDYVRQVRLHQWAKNLLIFAPLALAHRVSDTAMLLQTALGVLSFCLAASGGYVLNDLLDLSHDRRHHSKRRRPLASGAISIRAGAVLAVGLLAGGLAIVSFVSAAATACLAAYVVISLTYSLLLKKLDLIDVLTLAGLYTSRLVFGGLISRVQISIWLAGFSIFMFLSLAIGKRVHELKVLEAQQIHTASGRGYLVTDRRMMETMGICAGFISVLVLVLYMNSAEVIRLYSTPWLLWLIPPMVLFWIMRFWMCVERGLMTDDPLVFALKDRASFAVGLLSAITVRLAV